MKYVAVLCLGLLAGCSSLGYGRDDTPAQRLLALEHAYATAFILAARYENLPRCNPGSISICSNQDLVNRMRKTHTSVKLAFDAGWNIMRAGGSTEKDQNAAFKTARILVDGALVYYDQIRSIITGEK